MKQIRLKPLIIITAVIIAMIGVIKLSDPRTLANAFVAVYGSRIETECADSLIDGAKKLENLPAMSVKVWHGKSEHDMIEFLLAGSGLAPSSSYYGCYYSPDDVPLAFQGMDVTLTEEGPGYWTWTESGDNRGATSKIRDRWYYFEASF